MMAPLVVLLIATLQTAINEFKPLRLSPNNYQKQTTTRKIL